MNEEDSVAQHFASSSELIFLQEIPPGDHGTYRLKQLARAMNGTVNSSSSSIENRFNYLLGRETVVLDKTSQPKCHHLPCLMEGHSAGQLDFVPAPTSGRMVQDTRALGINRSGSLFSHFTINWSRFCFLGFSGRRSPFNAIKGYFYRQQDDSADQITLAAEQDC